MPGDGSGQDRYDEVVEFGSGRSAGRRWGSRALLACLVVAALTIAVRGSGQQARPAAKGPPPPPPVHVTAIGHRLLGVTAGWQLFARGPDDLLQIQLDQGKITETYVPPLQSATPDVAFLIGARKTIIRSADQVPSYVVPRGGQARELTGPLAGSGPLVPGPAGTQTAWVTTGAPTAPVLSLVTLAGHRSGPSIQFPPGGPQLPATAFSDGRGDVLVTAGSFSDYDAGPGWDRPVPGTIVAVGPANWLVVTCDALHRHCRNEVIDSADGSRRALPGAATDEPNFPGQPTGVIAPNGSAAAVAENGRHAGMDVYLINLHTGAAKDLHVSLGVPGSDVPVGAGPNDQSMAWSPDSRWLFVATAGAKLVAVNARTGRAESLGVRLPPVYQVATEAAAAAS